MQTEMLKRKKKHTQCVPEFSDIQDRQICMLICEYVKKKRETEKDNIIWYHRFSDGSALTTGYSLQSSGELLRCNCLLLLLSNSCHFHVALPFPGLV